MRMKSASLKKPSLTRAPNFSITQNRAGSLHLPFKLDAQWREWVALCGESKLCRIPVPNVQIGGLLKSGASAAHQTDH
jgi:hypothetical protein